MITNFEVALLYKFLISPKADYLVLTFKGNLAVQKNIKNISGFYEFLTALEMKQKKSSDSYLEYDRKYKQCIQEHASRDENGQVIEKDQGILLNDVEEFNKDMEVLMSTYREVIDEHQNKLKEWEDYIQSEYEGEILMIEESDVEFGKLSKADFQAFSIMIRDPQAAEEVPEETSS